MNIFITGASGFIGQNLIQSLLKAQYNIIACNHKSELPFEIKIFKFDFVQMTEVRQWMPYLYQIDVVINCVGIIAENSKQTFDVMHYLAPMALFKACEKTNVKRIIQISALGADETAQVAYHKSKKKADDYLRQSQLEWIVLRPSLIYGEGGKSYGFFKYLSNLPITPVMGGGQQLIQPIHINRMVEVIEKCIVTKQCNQTIDVVDEKPVTYKQWMKKLRDKKSPSRFIHMSMKLMRLLVGLLKPFNLQLLSKDNLVMLEQNNVADYQQLKEFMHSTGDYCLRRNDGSLDKNDENKENTK